ncbi:MAG: VCBS domain-containing protein, partial [Smithella sp.]|nr:VCBS domain-containing protein [Smithella sp.]
NAAQTHDQPTHDTTLTDSVGVTVTGVGGTTDSANLTINIVDDTPVAVNDGAFTVTEDGTTSVSGNVLTDGVDDSYGADGSASSNALVWDADTAAKATLATYGTLTENADGSYSYVLNNSSAAVQALTAGSNISADLGYTITDADGDTSHATLTIKITGDNDSSKVTVSAEGADSTVYEKGLTSVADTSETDSDSFGVSSTDGIAKVTIGGTEFTLAQLQAIHTSGTPSGGINTGEGTLVITNYEGSATSGTVSYNYTLNAAQTHDQPTHDTTLTDSVGVTVTGVGGTTDSANLTINIVDDVPVFTHIDNGIIANEAGILTGTHDINFGADGEGVINLTAMTSLSGVNYSSAIHNDDGSTTITAGTGTDTGGSPITNGFFALTVNPNGTYDFNLIEARPTIDHTVVFPEISGGAGVSSLTIGTGEDAITFTGIGGDTIKPTSAGFGVNDGNLNYGDEWSITFNGNGIDSVTYDIKQQGSKPLTMHWYTDAGDSDDVSYSADGTFTIDPAHDFHTIYFSVGEDSNAKVDSFSYSQNLLPESQNLQFGVSAIDSDGDISAPHTLNIELLGGDHIIGGAGNDILTGEAGDDLMTGGAGADIFKTGVGNDHIMDFNLADGDKVDISAVLNTVETDHSRLDVHTDVDTGKAVLDIYDASGTHTSDHIVASVTFDNINGVSDLTTLNNLLGDIDHTV